MVTLLITVLRERPAMKPVRPARAPLERPKTSIGDFTAADVMLTMRPNLRAIMPSIVALMSSIGASMLASIALIQSSRVQSWKSPGGGPPALLTRMSGLGHALSAAARPASVVMSPGTAVTLAAVASRISLAVFSRSAAVRAVMTSSTPSRASAMAQPLPKPLLAAHTIARLPRMPKSMVPSPSVLRREHDARELYGNRSLARQRRPVERRHDFLGGAHGALDAGQEIVHDFRPDGKLAI